MERIYNFFSDQDTSQNIINKDLIRINNILKNINTDLCLETIIEIEPDNPRPYMVRGDIYFNIEDYERAETLGYSIAVQKQPELIKGWKCLYKVYQAQDKVDMMIMTISRILEFDTENEEALWNRSELNYRLKKYTEAIADIHTLISVNPQHKKALQFKALILEKINEKGWN